MPALSGRERSTVGSWRLPMLTPSPSAIARLIIFAALALSFWSLWMSGALIAPVLAADAIAAAGVFYLNHRGSALFTERDAERRLGVPVFAMAPHISERELRQLPPNRRTLADYVLERPHSSLSAAYRGLARIASGAPGVAPVVAVTSPRVIDGGAEECLAFARTLAMFGKAVIVLDCDQRLHRLTNLTEINPRAGLWEVLEGKLPWREALEVDARSAVRFIAITGSGRRDQRPLFERQSFPALLGELRGAFDFVILSCPSALGPAVTPFLMRYATLSVLVVRRAKSKIWYVRAAIDTLSRFPIGPAPGILLTGGPPAMPAIGDAAGG